MIFLERFNYSQSSLADYGDGDESPDQLRGTVHYGSPAFAGRDFGGLHPSKPLARIPCDIARVIKLGSRSTNLMVAARGNDQAMADRGLVIDMRSMDDAIQVGVSRPTPYVDFAGGVLWEDVLKRCVSEYGLAPLSNAGVGQQAFRFGPQKSKVMELKVVTSTGQTVICLETQNSQLTVAVLGQLRIITRARVSLQPTREMVRWQTQKKDALCAGKTNPDDCKMVDKELEDSELDWAWLPEGILASVLERLTEFCDFIRFRSVCQRWRLFGAESDQHNHSLKLHILKTFRNQLPLLTAPTMDNSKEKRSFYSVIDGVIYDFPLPVPCDRRFFGSSRGWLFSIDRYLVISLLNPFANQTIRLPEFKEPSIDYEDFIETNACDYFVIKGTLSADPSRTPNNYEVVVIYGEHNRLAVYKSGDETWTFLHLDKDYNFIQIMYHDMKLYGLGPRGRLMSVDVASNKAEVIIENTDFNTVLSYLVSSKDGEGDLLLVQRITVDVGREYAHYKTVTFKVFKLSKNEWIQMESIGDQTLFLGDNDSMSISTTDFPWCKSNCIYYIDHAYDTGSYFRLYGCEGVEDDTGYFNLEDGSFGLHYITPPSNLLSTIWILPNFKEKPNKIW